MPRKPMSGARISALMQEMSVSSLLRVIPYSVIEEALTETGTQSKRKRLLPASVVLLLVVMLGLNAEVSVRENLRMLLHSLRVRFGMDRIAVAGSAAISFARRRLGVKPLAWLFDRVARPLTPTGCAGCTWKGLRPVAIDGTYVEAQCTEKNCEHFGRPGNQHGKGGYPQVLVVTLIECATRTPFGFVYGPCRKDEPTLGDELSAKLQADMLLLADRAYFSFARWRDASERCGALLWRVKSNVKLKPVSSFDDGSYLAVIKPSHKLIAKGFATRGEHMTVRVVEYRPVMADRRRGEKVRLITDVLDPSQVTAEELAAMYPQRWAVEVGFDELKTHLRGPVRVLRAQLPELVEQEIHGFFLAYYVTRATMAEAARVAGRPPSELSFTHAVRVIRRHTSLFPSPS